jgi:hypothetical protein
MEKQQPICTTTLSVSACVEVMTIPSGRGKKGEELSGWLIDDTLLAT